MSKFRVPRTRRRVCLACDRQFAPKRSDAQTCSNGCWKELNRRREARARAEALFQIREKVVQNADRAWVLSRHQARATRQNLKADSIGHRHIRFMGTVPGVLAVQGHRENDLPWPMPWKPVRAPWFKELKHCPSEPEAGDPEVIDAVVEALQRETFGGSFIQREYEREFKAMLRGPVRRIALFVRDPDWKPALAWWQSAAPDPDDDWDFDDALDQFTPGDPLDAALLDGFRAFTPRGARA